MKLQIYCKNCKSIESHKKSGKIFECESCSNKFQIYCPECFYDDYKLIVFGGGNIYRCLNCKHTFRKILTIKEIRQLKINSIMK